MRTTRQDRIISFRGGVTAAAAAKLCVTNTRAYITHRDVVLLNIMSAARNEINVNRLEITDTTTMTTNTIWSTLYIQCDSSSKPFHYLYVNIGIRYLWFTCFPVRIVTIRHKKFINSLYFPVGYKNKYNIYRVIYQAYSPPIFPLITNL